MKADKRNQWTYKGCEIVPVDCQHPTWGKCGEPVYFTTAFRNRFWRVEFRNKTWTHVEFKSDARRCIDEWDALRLPINGIHYSIPHLMKGHKWFRPGNDG